MQEKIVVVFGEKKKSINELDSKTKRKKNKKKEEKDQSIGHQKIHGHISTASPFPKEK